MAVKNKIEHRKISEFTTDPHNANLGSERGLQVLDNSLSETGLGRSIVTDKNGVIIGGNKTTERSIDRGFEDAVVVHTDGKQLVVVQRDDLDLSDTRADNPARKLAYYDNRAGEAGLAWDANVIAADVAAGVDLSGMFTEMELEYILNQPDIDTDNGITPAQASITLALRFIVPPFSVLDARQGYWQERKRAWLALGLQSELGRGGAEPGGSPRPAATLVDGHTVRGNGSGGTLGAIASNQATRLSPDYKKRIQGKLPADSGGQPLPLDRMKNGKSPARLYAQDLMRGEHVVAKNGKLLAGTYHAGATPNDDVSRKNLAANRQGGARISTSAEWVNEHDISGNAGNQSGTSIFDPVLCELAYRWFSPPDGTVLDPFAGGSVRGIVAHKLGRMYTGIDLRAEQIAANEQQAAQIVAGNIPRWITGDSCNIPTLLPEEQFDYIFSCPPYFDLEIYSDTEGDLSNAGDYQTFLVSYRAIIAACIAKLKTNRFACFVVGDMRDKKGMYRNFVSDTIAAFQDEGAALYNEVILVTSVGSLPIRVRKQFESGRKLGKTHQNVLVFIKGDPKKAVEACGDVEAYWPDDTESAASPYGEKLHVS